MALANYTDLKASVAAWLNRADLTATIPDFILLAESRFNRTLRARQMETKANLSITGEYVAVPSDWLEFRSGYIDSAPRRPLAYLSGDTQSARYDTTSDSTSGPVYFSIAGTNFRFSPTPTVVNAVILYYAAIPAMASNATNWLLTAYPDAYLYGSILQASGYIQDDPRVPGIKQAYDEVIAQITYASTRARWGGPGMATRAA